MRKPEGTYVPLRSGKERIIRNGFAAEILVDEKSIPPVFHWLVQHLGSAEVLYWAQERSFEDAERNATDFLEKEAASGLLRPRRGGAR